MFSHVTSAVSGSGSAPVEGYHRSLGRSFGQSVGRLFGRLVSLLITVFSAISIHMYFCRYDIVLAEAVTLFRLGQSKLFDIVLIEVLNNTGT